MVGVRPVGIGGDAVGGLVTVPDQGGEVLQVAGVGCAAEDDLHDRGVPDRVRLVLSPISLAPAPEGSCSTGNGVIPVPPPSAINVGRLGSGEVSISSNASNNGGSIRAPGERAAIFLAVSTRSSMNAATSAEDAPAPAPAKEAQGSVVSEEGFGVELFTGRGDTASRTRGSASAENASETPCQMESRVRGSACTMASRESAHPCRVRMRGEDSYRIGGEGRVQCPLVQGLRVPTVE